MNEIEAKIRHIVQDEINSGFGQVIDQQVSQLKAKIDELEQQVKTLKALNDFRLSTDKPEELEGEKNRG